MVEPKNNSLQFKETEADRRRGILDDNALSVDLVSAFAGDRPLTEAERKCLVDRQKNRGFRFFSDLLYSITHQYFPPEIAEGLWTNILHHKIELSALLLRNVKTAVATLDYLSNITGTMQSATLVDEAVIEKIVGLSLRDGLTGLFNHTYFFQQIDLEVRRYVRYGSRISLILIDIDDFKGVNDTYGHQEGDRILALMGKTLMLVARDSDICCRYGGEEFAVILPLTDVYEAGAIANRMKNEMAQHLEDGRMITVSIGVSSCGNTTRTYHNLIEKADAALYRGKRNGKNRVEIAIDEITITT